MTTYFPTRAARTRRLFAAACLFAVAACVTAPAANARPYDPDTRQRVPKNPRPPRKPPEPGAFFGTFTGATDIVKVNDERYPGKPRLEKVDSVNLLPNLNLAWNARRAAAERQLETALTAAGLHDVNVNLAVSSASRMQVRVVPSRKYVRLALIVPGNQLTARKHVRLARDPKISFGFSLVMSISLATDGRLSELVKLQSATLRISQVKNLKVGGDPVIKALNWLSGNKIGKAIRRAVNGRSRDISGSFVGQLDQVNDLLQKYIRNGHIDVKPYFDKKSRHLQFRMSRPRPSRKNNDRIKIYDGINVSGPFRLEYERR